MDSNSSVISLNINYCTNSTANNNKCAPREEQQTFMTQVNMLSYSLDSYINLNNYTNPVNYYAYPDNFLFSPGFSKKYVMTYKLTELFTDSGIILEDVASAVYYQKDKMESDVQNMGSLFQFTLMCSHLTDNYYPSIQRFKI